MRSMERGTGARVLALALFSAALLAGSVVRAAPEEDLVSSLPGLDGNLVSKMYSGYMRPSTTDFVHYMLVESESSPETAPLVLWVQGGPGASSLMGAFQELGPYIIATNTTLVKNEFAWSTVANILFLESPTGVGFSYCKHMPCKQDDISTAELNLASLRYFVDVKFPEYQGRDFMIWGESYAGVFIPTLASALYDHRDEVKLNFLGFGVGDPCTSEVYQHLSDKLHFNLQYAYQNGFISAQSHQLLSTKCLVKNKIGNLVPDVTSSECKLAWRLYWVATSNNDGQNPLGLVAHLPGWERFINTFNSFGPAGGPFSKMLREYLNTEAVKEALHVSNAPIGGWGISDNLIYTKQHLACYYEENTSPNDSPQFKYGMLPFYEKLVGKLRNIVVFNGDTDPDVQYRGTEAAVESLQIGKTKGGDWRPWFFKPNGASEELLTKKAPQFGQTLSYR